MGHISTQRHTEYISCTFLSNISLHILWAMIYFIIFLILTIGEEHKLVNGFGQKKVWSNQCRTYMLPSIPWKGIPLTICIPTKLKLDKKPEVKTRNFMWRYLLWRTIM